MVGGWYFSMLDVLFSRWVFIHLSLHESTAKVLGMLSPEMKNEFTLCCQIINSLESVGMEGNRGFGWPWKVEVMVEKGINFIFCLGTAYDVSSMESIGIFKLFSVVGKVCLSKIFLSLNLSFELWHLYKSLLPSAKGLSFTLCNFSFWIWVSIFSYKAPTKGHYDRIWALGVANIRVCFMNGSMIEHDGLGITCFSVDILKNMVACWYAWVLKSSCQN